MPVKPSKHRNSLLGLVGKIIALDFETTGLQLYHGDRLFCVGYRTDAGESGYIRKSKYLIRELEQLINDPTVTLVFHNAKFDLTCMMVEGIDIFNAKAHIDCTLVMSKVLFSTAPAHDLLTLAKKLLKRDTEDKVEITDWIKSQNTKRLVQERGRNVTFYDAPDDLVRRRVMWDAESTLLLYQKLKPKIDQTCPSLYETERQLTMVCIDMERTGVCIDITRAKELKQKALVDLDRIRDDLDKLVLPLTIINSKGSETIDDHFNPGSPLQMEAAFTKLGIQLKYKTKAKKGKKGGKKTGGGRWSFDEYAMVRYVRPELAAVIRESGEDGWDAHKFYDSIHETIRTHKISRTQLLPPLVLKYRELSKMVTTYYDHLIDDCTDRWTDKNGREFGILHCHFNPSEAMTGRFSSSNINLQNLPRILGPRECFVPIPGYWNWHFDYDQVEMRFFVHFARDPKMAAAIDDDIHLYTAVRIYKKPREEVTKEQRKRAKSTNFGIIYGSGAETQAETLTRKGLPTTTMESARFIALYHLEFPSVRRTTNELKLQLARRGYVVNPFGRRYHIPTERAYVALNYQCQGSSADLMKRAMVKIWKWLRFNEFRTKIIMTIHDELVFQIPPDEVLDVVPIIQRFMEDRKSFFVPITVDAEVVTERWSKKEDPSELGFNF